MRVVFAVVSEADTLSGVSGSTVSGGTASAVIRYGCVVAARREHESGGEKGNPKRASQANRLHSP